MDYEITERLLEPRATLVIKGVMPVADLPAFFGPAYGELFAFAIQHGATPEGVPFARYWSVAPERAEVEAGVTVAKAVAGEGRIEASTLPGGDAAVTTHIGPYDGMAPAYAAIETWMRSHGRAASGPPWEVYFSDPQTEPDPQKWRTEVVWPLNPRT